MPAGSTPARILLAVRCRNETNCTGPKGNRRNTAPLPFNHVGTFRCGVRRAEGHEVPTF